jgi:hypothetical protein
MAVKEIGITRNDSRKTMIKNCPVSTSVRDPDPHHWLIDPDPTPFFIDCKGTNKIFFHIFFSCNLPAGTLSSMLKI